VGEAAAAVEVPAFAVAATGVSPATPVILVEGEVGAVVDPAEDSEGRPPAVQKSHTNHDAVLNSRHTKPESVPAAGSGATWVWWCISRPRTGEGKPPVADGGAVGEARGGAVSGVDAARYCSGGAREEMNYRTHRRWVV